MDNKLHMVKQVKHERHLGQFVQQDAYEELAEEEPEETELEPLETSLPQGEAGAACSCSPPVARASSSKRSLCCCDISIMKKAAVCRPILRKEYLNRAAQAKVISQMLVFTSPMAAFTSSHFG